MNHLTTSASLVYSLIGVAMSFSAMGCAPTSSAPESPDDQVCKVNIKTLGTAIASLRAHSGDVKSTIVGPQGHRHSWRVAISPLSQRYNDYFDYHLDEPWNSSYNLKQFQRFPTRLTCPSESKAFPYPYTSYLMIVRMKTNSAGVKEEIAINQLPDKAVIIVESAMCRVQLGEPRDIHFDQLFNGYSCFGPGKLNSLHSGFVWAILADGNVIKISKSLSKDDTRRIIEGVSARHGR